MVTPGSGSAEIVAELSWLNCSIAAGAAPVAMLTTAESGTISPFDGAHEVLRQAFRVVAEFLRHLGDDVVAVESRSNFADRARRRPAAPSVSPDFADRHVERRRAVAVDRDRTCGASKASEFCTTMKLPEACAFFRTSSATS